MQLREASPDGEARPLGLRPVATPSIREAMAANPWLWRATYAVYAAFAILCAIGAHSVRGEFPDRLALLAVWLGGVAIAHAVTPPPAVGSRANHLVVACAWCSVGAGFVGTQPAGGVALGGMMFIGPLIAVRLDRRRDIALHALGASALFDAVALSGLAGFVTPATALLAASSGLLTQVQAYACMRILEATERQSEEVRRLAATDLASGAYNRRYFNDALAHRTEDRIGGVPFCLIALHLRLRGDRPASLFEDDEFVRHCVLAATEVLPPGATIARVSDDELCVLVDADPPRGELLRSAATAAIGRAARAAGRETEVRAAVAAWPHDARTPGGLFRCADLRISADRHPGRRPLSR